MTSQFKQVFKELIFNCESDIFANEDYLEGLKLDLVQDESSAFIKDLTKHIIESNEELMKEHVRQNIFCNISNKTIANEKAFDLEKSIEEILNDFKKSFYYKKFQLSTEVAVTERTHMCTVNTQPVFMYVLPSTLS